jgi:hypothetical protein
MPTLLFADSGHNATLVVIFLFVIVLASIRRIYQWQRDKLWHETARLALEKGQPLPPAFNSGCYGRWRGGRWWILRRGLVLIGVGIGLYFALPDHSRNYGAIPASIGAALLVTAAAEFLFARKDDPKTNLPPRA